MTPALILESVEQFNKFQLNLRKSEITNARLIGFYFANTMGAKLKMPEDLGKFSFEESEEIIKKGKITKWQPSTKN